MISQLLSTIMMALGIATGNVSSNVYKGGNVFNNENQSQPIKKATTTDEIDIYYTKVGEWHDTSSQDQYYTEFNKYYISQDIQMANYYLNNMNIYNSIYSLSFRDPTYPSWWSNQVYHIYKITNYYDSGTQFDIAALVQFGSTINQSTLEYGYQNYYSRDESLDSIIDLTMTQSSNTQIINTIENAEKTLINQNSNYSQQDTTSSIWLDDSTTIAISGQETLYLILRIYCIYIPTNINISSDIILETGKITTIYAAPTYNYEIVDLPGVMFSVLSMPFAFISTAFNLTIFPNTPYQLNFANLFMVILAAFILMWLIKKVFH